MNSEERRLRERLSVPEQAERVLVLGETSHWDPNWLFTSEQYYRLRIRAILEEVLAELAREPRRVFAIESLFFFRMFWERVPELRDQARAAINSGQLRLTGSGITTPDTVLPDTEAIIRDYLYGQEWLREQGMTAEPRLAYLPDDFGHSPALPALLGALGYTQAAVTRIDGMFFVGTDLRRRSRFPLAGSSAELLQEKLKTLDFIWRAPDGAEVLCHWNAFSYFQGDMLAHRGIIRWMGLTFGVKWRTARHVAKRIDGFVDQLRPLSRTPYMFCPMGCDFIGPLPNLVELLDRYNATRFAESGTWVVNAGMDDYLDLVDCRRDALPALELDPNPYWMGFYASRPETKYRTNRITCKLELAEKLAVAETPKNGVQRDLRGAWDLIVVSNHHDFITGTSPDRVWHEEQRPWLCEAETLADRGLASVCCHQCGDGSRRRLPRWRRDRSRVEVQTTHYRLILDEAAGGCVVSLTSVARPDEQLVSGPANDLVAYGDSGGLWRMGHEYLGGEFRERGRASLTPASIEVRELEGRLEIRVASMLCGRRIVRLLWFEDDSPMIRMRIVGAASTRRTIACRFPVALNIQQLVMDVPGGVVSRPTTKLYEPTFWPARTFVHAQHASSDHDRGMVAFLGGPACVSVTAPGVMEWVALRNVHREVAYRVVPIVAHPASGRDPDEHNFEYAVSFTESGDFRANRVPRQARRLMREIWLPDRAQRLCARADDLVTVDHDLVAVSALKRADRGDGLVVRLTSYTPGPVTVQLRLNGKPLHGARLCDARERDGAGLIVEGQSVEVPVRGALTTVRLLVNDSASAHPSPRPSNRSI